MPEYRIVTLAEARAALPAVREVLAAMRNARDRLAAPASPTPPAGSNGHTNGHRPPAAESASAPLRATIRDGIERLAALGCEVKDLEQGLIDFHAMREGREVYLCWRHGEDDIRFWHDLHTGFAGRRPLEEDTER